MLPNRGYNFVAVMGEQYINSDTEPDNSNAFRNHPKSKKEPAT